MGKQTADSNINAWLLENTLYLSPKTSWDVEPLHIAKGGQVYRLNNLETTSGRELLLGGGSAFFPLHEQSLSINLQGDKKTPFRHGVNKLNDFILPGKKTLSLCIGDEAKACRINIAKNIDITSLPNEQLQIKALLGIHRGEGKLIAEIEQENSITKVETEFSVDHKGGTESHQYKRATLNLPSIHNKARLSLYVKHQKYIPWETTDRDDTFYFIADLKITERSGQPTLARKSRVFPGSQGFPNMAKVLTSTIEPFLSRNDQPIRVQWRDGSSTELFKPVQTAASIRGLEEANIVASSSTPGLHNIYINGRLSSTEFVDKEKTLIPINSAFLDGDPAQVELRDISGSQTLATKSLILRRAITSESKLCKESKFPFPTDLTVRSGHRYESIRKHLANPLPGSDSKMLSQALETLDHDYDGLKLKYLDLPTQRNPKVSIIIPAHNKINATYYCLCSILVAYNTTSYEVIVVDDGSSDETKQLEDIVTGVKVIHNTEPQRFIEACNAGAKQARGEYIVLLNNDTEVTNGWIDEMIQAFDRFENVGAVGSKLLYPDGTLQGAGGIVWGSGNPWNYGTGQNPWDPRFMYPRQVDYICGAALMTPKSIWKKVGGLSEYLKPMYFEDTDYSFKVREAGYKTYFIPSSIVYHHEGLTSGTDTSSGFKRYQEVNRPKFKKAWVKDFWTHGKDGVEPDLEKDRGIAGRVLFIDYTTPREDRDAGSYAAIQEIKLVQSLGYKVTFVPKNLDDFGVYTQTLRDMGVEVIVSPFYRSVADFIAHRGEEFACAYITRYYVAQESISPLREHAPNCKIIMNNADLHFLRELRSAGDDPEQLERASEVRELELEMMIKSDLVVSYNETEHAVIQAHTDNDVKVMNALGLSKHQPSSRASIEQPVCISWRIQTSPNKEGILVRIRSHTHA